MEGKVKGALALARRFIGTKKLEQDARGATPFEFLDRYSGEHLPEHHRTGRNPAPVIHDHLNPYVATPSEYDRFAEMIEFPESEQKIAEYAASLHRRNQPPPVLIEGTVTDPQMAPMILDGHHRTLAARVTGDTLPALYDLSTMADLWRRQNARNDRLSDIMREYRGRIARGEGIDHPDVQPPKMNPIYDEDRTFARDLLHDYVRRNPNKSRGGRVRGALNAEKRRAAR